MSQVIKSKPDGGALLGVSVERPWRGMPISTGEIELDGQFRTKYEAEGLDLIVDGEIACSIPLQDRSGAAQRGEWAERSLVYGFFGSFPCKGLTSRSTLSLQVRYRQLPPLKIAFLHVHEPHYTAAQKALLLPDFIVAGVMKAGTTAVYDLLCRHPSVIERLPKEIHFFNDKWDKGLDYYRSYFVQRLDDAASGKQLVGEATPGYVSPYAPECATRVREVCPEARIIVVLRDPVDRAISHYHHKRNTMGLESRTIEEAFSDEAVFSQPSTSEDYLTLGHYAECLTPWLKAFPDGRLLVLNFHDLARQPDALLDKLFSFVGLDRPEDIKVRKMYSNEYAAAPPEVLDRLRRYFAPYNETLRALLGDGLAF